MNIGTVYCLYPSPIDDDGFPATLPDGFDEFRTSAYCTHDYCIEAARAHAQWRGESGYRESVALAREDVGDDVRRLKR